MYIRTYVQSDSYSEVALVALAKKRSQSLDPEIAEMLLYLDQEIMKMVDKSLVMVAMCASVFNSLMYNPLVPSKDILCGVKTQTF